jgi:hypothetical protein
LAVVTSGTLNTALTIDKSIDVAAGWQWDKRAWPGDHTENNYIGLPVIWDPSTSGITKTHFQSGVGSGKDLKLEDIIELPSSGLHTTTGVTRIWAPEVNHGYYFEFDDGGYLYSDDSQVVYPSYSGVELGLNYPTDSGFNSVLISGISKVGVPITANRWRWNPDEGEYDIHLALRKKITFAGVRDEAGARQETFDENKQAILYGLIDRDEDEFTVTFSGDFTKIVLNDQYVYEEGDPAGLPSGLNSVGISDGTVGQQFHLEFAPVDNTMPVTVVSYLTASGTLTQWDIVSAEQTPQEQAYEARLDYDLGILEFGDSVASGVWVPPAGETIGVAYWPTLRVEYEPDLTGDTVIAPVASTNPVYRKSSVGFVRLATREDDPASITLVAELPSTQTDVYGPMPIGNSFAPLVATVKDSKDRLLEDQEVTFFVSSVPIAGSFGSLGNTISSITDQFGEARSFYNPPKNIAEIGEDITASGHSVDNSPTYSGTSQVTTLHAERILVEGPKEDIFLYQVHVDDASLGFMDVTVDQDSIDAQIDAYYQEFFEEHQIFGPTGLTTSSGLTAGAIDWEDLHRTMWDLTRPSIFQPNLGLGRRVLVATLNSGVLNPHTFEPPAVAPVTPIDLRSTADGGFDIVYDTSEYTIPPPSGTLPGPTGTLHSYFIVSPTAVRLQASVFNRRLNRDILSNEIQIRLSIPPYLNGMWTIDAINQSHIDEISPVLSGVVASGQKAALGFRLRSSNVTLAAALDGVTFLDTNPAFTSDVWDEEDGVAPLRQELTVSGIT